MHMYQLRFVGLAKLAVALGWPSGLSIYGFIKFRTLQPVVSVHIRSIPWNFCVALLIENLYASGCPVVWLNDWRHTECPFIDLYLPFLSPDMQSLMLFICSHTSSTPVSCAQLNQRSRLFDCSFQFLSRCFSRWALKDGKKRGLHQIKIM